MSLAGIPIRKARGLKVCSHCKEPKPLNCYSLQPSRADGRDARCKSCVAIYQRSRSRLCEYCRKINEHGGRWCSDDCQTAHRLRAAVQLQRPKAGMLIAEQGAPKCPVCASPRVWYATDRIIGFTVVRCSDCEHEGRATVYRGVAP